MEVSTKTSFCGVAFRNPVVIASTDIGRSAASFERYAKTGVGGIILKSVTDAAPLQHKGITMFDIRDMEGVPLSEVERVPDKYSFFSRGGSMVAMDTFEETAREMLDIARRYDVVPIASICAGSIENWVAYAKRFEAMGYPMLELNLGNPHGEAAKQKLGFRLGQEAELCAETAAAVIAAVQIPVVVKLTPQVADIVALTQRLEQAGVQAVTIMHRFQGLVIDHETFEPVLGGYAAIGGPWMKPLSLANVAKVHNATKLAIMGGNGADTAQDVLDFLLAGASLVQIGSSMMLRGSEYAARLAKEVAALINQTGKSVAELSGLTAAKIVPYKELSRIAARQAVLDSEKCCDCINAPCVGRCCYGALTVRDGAVVHDVDSCSGCGMCQTICPRHAVRIEKQ